MKDFFNKPVLLTLVILLGACSSEDDLIDDWIETTNGLVETPTAGTLDLSNYVAVGNSLTAGFSDAALYPEGQANSMPSILANQLALVGGGTFTYPDISSGNGFGNEGGKSFIDLDAALAALMDPPQGSIGDAIQFTEGTPLSPSTVTGSDLNNFGVPGARVVDLTTVGYGSPLGNPFFAAFATSPTTTVLKDAVSANGSFFSLWIGSNDVLGYALDGGNDTPNVAGTNVITPTSDFQTDLATVLNELSASGAEGVILNIPPVTIIPFFQTVTALSGGIKLIPLDAATAAGTQAAYNDPTTGYNPGLDVAVLLGIMDQEEADLRKISWVEGANPPVITDESLTTADISTAFFLPAGSVVLPNIRQARVDATTGSSDLFPLTALDSIGVERVAGDATTTIGVGVPIPDRLSLTIAEQVAVITAYATFNGIIAAEAAARDNVTLVDIGPLFADVFGLSAAQAQGLGLSVEAQAAADGVLGTVVGGITLEPLSLTSEAIFNSIWSTDGVHANPRGNALVVNEIIEALNAQYGATIPSANPLDYPAINVPF